MPRAVEPMAGKLGTYTSSQTGRLLHGDAVHALSHGLADERRLRRDAEACVDGSTHSRGGGRGGTQAKRNMCEIRLGANAQ